MTSRSTSRPSDICLTLATVANGWDRGDGWLSADEVRGRLVRLGFEEVTTRQVSPWLRRLTRMDAPPVESRTVPDAPLRRRERP